MRWLFFLAVLVGCVNETGDKSTDVDGDGLAGADDCDDTDANVGAPTSWLVDADGDGYAGSSSVAACERPDAAAEVTGDCDDGEVGVHPGAEELCDGNDNDCDGAIDEGVGQTFYADADKDGFGDLDAPVVACEQPEGSVTNAGDCDDADPDRFPENEEVCNEIDDDCDAEVDEAVGETFYADTDGDGHGDPSAPLVACELPDGFTTNADDCDDGDALIFPMATELCNGADDDCDGVVDEDDAADASTWFIDADADGHGVDTFTVVSCVEPAGYAASPDDCDDGNDLIHPGASETDCTDPVDYNCDGSVAYADADSDGWAACSECDDADGGVNPAATEVCDGKDNDCDGTVDEPDAADVLTWYSDTDGDGYGDASSPQVACDAPASTVADDTDCDDTRSDVSPGTPELCNGFDDDCDGEIDEASATDASVWYADADTDGYGDPATAESACDAPAGYVADASDCDDGRKLTNPGATEYCNTEDDDCNGVVDDAAADARTYWADADGDTYGDASVSTSACATPAGYVRDDDDCDDTEATVHPAGTEVCDGLDNNCDGVVDDVASYANDFDSGISSSEIVLNGTATAASSGGNGFLRLIDLSGSAAGTAWLVERQEASDFEVSFSFQIHGGSGADGLTFAWLSDTSTSLVGSTGGYLGAFGLNGYAVEFDTWTNEWDPGENHVALINPATFSTYASSTAIPELEDTGWHDVTITNTGGTVEVWLNGIQYINYAIPGYSMTDAMMGFTAATGGATNYHDIDDFEIACP
jgi:hypothetical protein